MDYQKIEVEQAGSVGVIRLNDPAALNAVDIRMVEEVLDATDRVAASSRVMILTGAGRAFCSGANLGGGLDTGATDEEGPDFGASLESHVNPLISKLRALPIPWISAVRGAAAGVGCPLALAADFVVASDTAYFLQAFARIGLVPDGGSSYLLARGLTHARAMQLMMLGERLPAATALEWGLIYQVVPDAELEASAMALAERLAAGPSRTLGMIRKLAWDARESDWESTLRMEREMQRIAGHTHDANEGILAFREKRPARFEGR